MPLNRTRDGVVSFGSNLYMSYTLSYLVLNLHSDVGQQSSDIKRLILALIESGQEPSP